MSAGATLEAYKKSLIDHTMLNTPIAEANRSELDAELALYSEALGEGADIKTFGIFAPNADRVAEVERLRSLHGTPVKLTPEFIAGNALGGVLMANGAQEGTVVFASEADFIQASQPSTPTAPIPAAGSPVALDLLAKETKKYDLDGPVVANGLVGVDSEEVIVCDVKGNPARTYSLSVHGPDFRKLAEEFASKHEGWTVR